MSELTDEKKRAAEHAAHKDSVSQRRNGLTNAKFTMNPDKGDQSGKDSTTNRPNGQKGQAIEGTDSQRKSTENSGLGRRDQLTYARFTMASDRRGKTPTDLKPAGLAEPKDDQRRTVEKVALEDSGSHKGDKPTQVRDSGQPLSSPPGAPPDQPPSSPPGTLPDQPPSSPPDASADQPGHNFKVTADPDQLIDYTFDSKRGRVSFQHKLDNPKIMGGPTDTPISFGEDGIDPYQASVTYLSVIREGVAAREVAERPDVDQVRWGEPARDLIKERISPDELGSKHEPVAVDIIGVKGDLNDNPRFDLAEGKGNDLKLYQLDDNAWRLRPPGGQGGENIDRLDVYVPDGAIDKINQNSQMTNLRVNETAGILETRRDGSGLWQPRLVPELPGKPQGFLVYPKSLKSKPFLATHHSRVQPH